MSQSPSTTGTSASGSSLLPDSIGAITSAHFVLIAVLTVLVVLGILFGARAKNRRKAGEREVIAHNEEIAPAAAEERTPTPPVAPAPAAFVPTAAPTLMPAEDEAELTQLKGLGPKVATRLADLGITTLPQLAALSDAEAATLDAQLGPFAGRLTRDRWVEQAQFLAAGDREGFEAVFGRL